MTINQLIKALQKIEKKHGKRIRVCVNASAIRDYCEDFSHHDMNCVDVETIRWSIDDNAYLADGSERMRTIVSLQ